MKSASPKYYNLDELLIQIEGANGEACRRIYADLKQSFLTAPGAAHNHQVWPGGYADHIIDAMNIAAILHDALNAARPLPFSKSDAFLVIYLHDLEKPFRYSYSKQGELKADPELSTKEAKEAKRKEVIEKYGIKLNAKQANALKYIEGTKDAEYSRGARNMGELGSLCHCADTLSARLWYNYPLPNGEDAWKDSARINPEATSITLPSEL